MSVTYKNPPLVELIAEVRWAVPTTVSAVQADGAGLQFAVPQAKDEEIFMHFGALRSRAGFGRFERLLPPGMPFPPSQVVARFRPTDPDRQAPLFQLGQGVYTANALRPYKSWHEFEPLVRAGVEDVIEAYRRASADLPRFNAVLVRYIDAFGPDLTGGMPFPQFLREVLNVRLHLPVSITGQAIDVDAIEPVIQLAVPTKFGSLTLTMGEGRRGNDRACMLDFTVLSQRDFGSDVAAVVAALTSGREVIHETFRGLTAPIHEKMEPL